MAALESAVRWVLTPEGLGVLLEALRAEGYRLIGPTLRDGAIVHAEISGIAELPAGWTADQAPGKYRLKQRDDGAFFGYSVGPHSYKQLFFVPRLRLWRARRKDGSFTVEEDRASENRAAEDRAAEDRAAEDRAAEDRAAEDRAAENNAAENNAAPERLALIGARSCDLHAIEVQDRTFLQGAHVDADYAARRRDVFVVAVQCGQAGGTCFCASMQTGPEAKQGFDLALTELLTPHHRFVVEVGSERGGELLARAGATPADASDVSTAREVVEATRSSMGRQLDTTDIKQLLYRNHEHPRWDDVAERCLGCTNCTLACPTCFCSSVEDVSDLSGESAERFRRWDSCFTLDHSYLHGGSVRSSLRSRYRQWLTHKLASWIDQFGTSGCVGCGRCITWCPAAIDITEEVAAIRAADGAGAPRAASEEAK